MLRLGSLMRKLLASDMPPQEVAGDDGRVLLRPWDLSHEDYIRHAFDQIRQVAVSQPHVVATLLRVLRMLIEHARTVDCDQYIPPLRTQIRLLMESAESGADRLGLHPDDLRWLQQISRGADPAEHEL